MTHLVYVLRPDGMSLWLPNDLAAELGAAHAASLSTAQFNDHRVQDLIQRRRAAKNGDTPKE